MTTNKAGLAEYGEELFDRPQVGGVDLMFEVSVAGGIPIICSLRTSLAANRVDSVYRILKGTTNYLLTQMTRGTGDFDQSIELAQCNGFSESDLTMDLNG